MSVSVRKTVLEMIAMWHDAEFSAIPKKEGVVVRK